MKELYFYSPSKNKYFCRGDEFTCSKCGRPIEVISILLLDWDKKKSQRRHFCNKCASSIKTRGRISEAKIILLNQPLPFDAYPVFLKAPDTRIATQVIDASKLESISTDDRANVSKSQFIINRQAYEADQERLHHQKKADKRLDKDVDDIDSYLEVLSESIPKGTKQLR